MGLVYRTGHENGSAAVVAMFYLFINFCYFQNDRPAMRFHNRPERFRDADFKMEVTRVHTKCSGRYFDVCARTSLMAACVGVAAATAAAAGAVATTITPSATPL